MATCDVCGQVGKTRVIDGINFCGNCFADLQHIRAKDIDTIERYRNINASNMATKQAKDYISKTVSRALENLQNSADNTPSPEVQIAKDIRDKELTEIRESRQDNLLFSIEGVRGRHIDVYPYKCVITTRVTAGSIITNNATDGEKTIYFSDIIGVQFKKPGLAIGYLQLETAANLGNNDSSNFFSENTFTFDAMTREVADMYEYIIGKLDMYKSKVFSD